MKFLKKPVVWLVIAILYTAFICFLSCIPGNKRIFSLISLPFRIDLYFHFSAYAIQTLIVVHYLKLSRIFHSSAKIWLTAIVISALVGGGIELIQMHIPARSASSSDMVANLGGTLSALIWVSILDKLRSARTIR